MTSKEKIIYGLVDPNLNKIRYVGRSSSGLWRPNAHRHPSRLSKGKTYCDRWIRKLLADGQDYSVVVLETAVVDLNTREKYWVAYGKEQGWPLTNTTNGGQGWSGGHFTKEHRRKISESLQGRKLSVECLQKLSAVRRGRKLSQRHKDRLRGSRLGTHHTEEAKRKIGIGQAGKVMSEAGKQSLREKHSMPVKDLTTGVVYNSQKVAAKELGLCYRSVNRVLCGAMHTTGGRSFEYVQKNGS
jgi:hypothetical protein